MRAKNKSAVAITDLEKAWSAFYEATKYENENTLAEQGWKTVRAIATETKSTVAATNSRVTIAINNDQLEMKKARILTKQGLREVNLYRPILK